MTKEEIISSGLLEMYVLGNTTAAETIMVEQLCNQHPEIKGELNNIELAMESYAQTEALSPSVEVKRNIFNALNLNDKVIYTAESKIVSINSFAKYAIAASLILLAFCGGLIYSYHKRLAKNEEDIAALINQISEQKNEMNIVHSKYSLPLKMKPDIAPKDADAKIYWLTNTGEIYIDPSNLPATPAGMQYQLWAIVDGKAIDAGLIVSKDGKTLQLQKMKTFGKAQAFAVTLEKEGGVQASKEKPYVIVSL